MKNVLVYSVAWQGAQESLQIEEALNQYSKGNSVFWIYCDYSLGYCKNNPEFNKGWCKYCSQYQKMIRKRFLPSGIKQIPISSLIDSEMIGKASIGFKFTTAQEMGEVEFNGVEIGMGCLSSYISNTRNMDPLISSESKPYFDRILQSEILLTLAIEKFLEKEKIDLIVFHNGRFAQFKPLLNIAQNRNIDYICTESQQDAEGKILKNFFYNSIPHDFQAVKKKFFEEWEQADAKERVEIGKLFYERKRSNISTGDKVYTAGQQRGLLPSDWNDEVENIVICNSSEDEYCAIGKDYDAMKFFESQLTGIKRMAEHYKNDTTKHFYLRIHPNLKDIKYRYNTDLLKLDYPNLTVIPGNSPVSTYTLIDNSNKVIAFGSTAGIEAVYRHKPLISLGPAEYNVLDVAYMPKTEDDLWKYIDTANLRDLYNENVLKFGFYYMAVNQSKILEQCNRIDNTPVYFNILGKRYYVLKYQKLLGSNFLYMTFEGIIRRLCSKFCKKQEIPMTER